MLLATLLPLGGGLLWAVSCEDNYRDELPLRPFNLTPDMASGDGGLRWGPTDLLKPPGDMATPPPDMATPPDMARIPDLAAVPDLATVPDLTSPPD